MATGDFESDVDIVFEAVETASGTAEDSSVDVLEEKAASDVVEDDDTIADEDVDAADEEEGLLPSLLLFSAVETNGIISVRNSKASYS